MRARWREVVSLWVAMACSAACAAAQSTTLRVHVADTTGRAVSSAAVSIVAGERVLATARTDTAGVAVVRVPPPDIPLQPELVVRHLAFFETRRLVPRDRAATLEIVLAPVPTKLEAVEVGGRAIRQSAQPVIRSDEIMATTRGVFDFWDVLEKLRPQLLDHIGDDAKYKCIPTHMTGAVRIYVNEQIVPPMLAAVLRDVKYDAIEELRYVTCFDKSLAKDDYPSIGHIYVTLKKGYAFDLKKGSYLRNATNVVAAAPHDTATLHSAGARVLGVYDEVQGVPVEGAQVTNLLNGYSASTTRTGTVALAFVDSIGGLIRIERLGYAPLVLSVSNRAGDPPLTVTLKPRGTAQPRLPHLVDPADSVRKLLVAGFYERRDTLPVDPRAFLSVEQTGTLDRVSSAGAAMSRPTCNENLLIDGARVPPQTRIDDLLAPPMVAGIESYVGGEVPPEFVDTRSDHHCATLIWTR